MSFVILGILNEQKFNTIEVKQSVIWGKKKVDRVWTKSDWSAPASAARLTGSRCQAKRSRLAHIYNKTLTHTQSHNPKMGLCCHGNNLPNPVSETYLNGNLCASPSPSPFPNPDSFQAHQLLNPRRFLRCLGVFGYGWSHCKDCTVQRFLSRLWGLGWNQWGLGGSESNKQWERKKIQ